MKTGKAITAVISLFLVVCLNGCLAHVADTPAAPKSALAGHWDGTWESGDGSHVEKFSFDLAGTDEAVTGTGVDAKKGKSRITGKVAEPYFTLEVLPENAEDAVIFSGKLAKDQLLGVWKEGVDGGPWSAQRR